MIGGGHLLDEVCVGRGVEAGPRPLAAPAPRTRGDPHPAPGHHHVSGQRHQAGDSGSISIIITIRADKETSQFLQCPEKDSTKTLVRKDHNGWAVWLA